jgi:predicted flap endonuclease-1-like 5' DNA nuclease
MALSLKQLKGMSTGLAKKLRSRGITNSDQFLNAVRTAQQRRELSKELGDSENTLLELANRADLARVVGIGKVYSNLMENAGVDTVKELANRVPENLHTTLGQHNAKRRPKGRAPSMKEVTDWVNQAKALPKKLEY